MKVQVMDGEGGVHHLLELDDDVLTDSVQAMRYWAFVHDGEDYEGPHRVEVLLDGERPVVQIVAMP
jgi:hypothetical protein